MTDETVETTEATAPVQEAVTEVNDTPVDPEAHAEEDPAV